MKRKLTVFAMLAAAAVSSTVAMGVDVQTLAYSTSDGASGLRLAWRPDTLSQWIPLNYDFVKSDFGPWGSHKKMFRPKLVLDRNSGRWTATWEATPEGDVVAFTTTDNFADWAPQKYFASALDLPRDIIPARMPVPVRTRINGEEVEGWMQPMPEETIASIREYVKKRQDLAALYSEQAKDDASRFAGLGPVSISIHPRPEDAKSISDKLIGIFFEDINYGADGGLYAELIQNRDFEYSPSDHGGWDSMTAWTTSGDGVATVITVIGTVGPFYEGADYEAGWKLARELDVPIVDEHYYVAPGWLIYNRDYYDKYPRGGTKVYLGEYASHLPGRPSNVETALSDALYLTDVERNADVVAMTSYAPLLAKKGHTQWNPDLIYFDNTSVTPTVEYYVQKMFGNNSGQTYVPSDVAVGSDDMKVRARIGVSIVDDADSGDRILKLVNMLPVEVNADIDTVALGVSPGVYNATLLSGDPADTGARPVKTKISLPSVKLPPYSFTVVRLRK